MNIAQLRAFEAVAAHGGFTAAAHALGVSQPTVSEQVTALEREHGVRLIDRSTRPVSLTAIGTRLHAVAAPLFSAERQAADLLARAGGLETGELRIGADAPMHAMPILAEFHRRHPGISLRLTGGNSADLLRRLDDGLEDVVVAAAVPQSDALTTVELVQQDLVAVVRDDHPLAGRKTMRLSALATEQIVMREVGSVTRSTLEAAMAAAGLTPAGVLEVDGREALLAATAAGLGVGVIAENEMIDAPRLVMLDLRSPTVTVTEYLVALTANRATTLVDEVFRIADARRSPDRTRS